MPPDILPDAKAGTGAGTIAPVPPWEEKRGDGDPAPPTGERTEDGDRYAPVPPWEEKRGDGDPAPPRGERTEDGDRYAPVPNVDPGGRQRPEVIGTLCGRGRFKDPGRSRVRISDRRKYRSYRGRFRHGPHGHGPSSEGRRRSYRSNRDRFKKSN